MIGPQSYRYTGVKTAVQPVDLCWAQSSSKVYVIISCQKPQIRVVPPQKIMKTLPNMKVVKNGSQENFVPYGKLYRTVLKNGKAIQTPVVTPSNDMKFKVN